MPREPVPNTQRSRSIGVQNRKSAPGGGPSTPRTGSSILEAEKAPETLPRLVDELRAKYPGMARLADTGHRQKAIRLFCLECMGGSAAEVGRCESHACPLWPYRLGRGVKRRPAR